MISLSRRFVFLACIFKIETDSVELNINQTLQHLLIFG